MNIKPLNIPYPYKAIFAICSDLDETPDKYTYIETMRYLNTSENTKIGKGVGLEVGNTIYFDMPPEQFSYWNTDEKGRAFIREIIKSGHIDCLHSYGDFTSSRKRVESILEELSKHDCRLEVWIDHGTAPSNFDGDIMQGQGDLPGSKVYHSDITCDYGIKYVWKGRVTSVLGQNCRRNLNGIWNTYHPARSAKTITKEAVKGFLGSLNNKKYAMHAPNQVLRECQLRDGRNVHEFIRSNPYWGGVDQSATGDGLGSVVTENMLETLIDKRGICILYTHLGKISDKINIFGESTKYALKILSQKYKEKKILVTTTRRILDYLLMIKIVKIEKNIINNDTIHINIEYDDNISKISGLTFHIDKFNKYNITFNNKKIENYSVIDTEKEQQLISIHWDKLIFPDI